MYICTYTPIYRGNLSSAHNAEQFIIGNHSHLATIVTYKIMRSLLLPKLIVRYITLLKDCRLQGSIIQQFAKTCEGQNDCTQFCQTILYDHRLKANIANNF